jgi:hypothetical protein
MLSYKIEGSLKNYKPEVMYMNRDNAEPNQDHTGLCNNNAFYIWT